MAAAPEGAAVLADRLPEFPWDVLTPYAERAARHPGGIVDLSVGTPVDPTPPLLREVLAASADAAGYPLTAGTAALREAVVSWFARRRGVPDLDPAGVLPTIGSKELVAWLPTLLGLGAGDVVVHPEIAYPTYDVGARLAGATPVPARAVTAVVPGPRLIWINSPSNPTGQVLSIQEMRDVVDWGRARGAVVASDECYAELGWDIARPPSILHPDVCGGSHDGLLAVYSLSKQSNLAGYRAAFVAGDVGLVSQLLAVRRHAGMIVPGPVQATMVAALGDDAHVADQKRRYADRRAVLLAALRAGGWRIDHSQAGLYLWATRDEDCWASVEWFAARGVLVAPGAFYGTAGSRHVRLALTATDERVAAAAERVV